MRVILPKGMVVKCLCRKRYIVRHKIYLYFALGYTFVAILSMPYLPIIFCDCPTFVGSMFYACIGAEFAQRYIYFVVKYVRFLFYFLKDQI